MNKRYKNKRPSRPEKEPVKQAIDFKRPDICTVALLCVLGFLVYSNSLNSTFHFDDFAVIVNNPAIREVWNFKILYDAFNTRVLTGWTFAFNYAFNQLDVFGYHFLSIWLHILNAVLVYALGQQLIGLFQNGQQNRHGPVRWVSLAGALIFLVHPLQTQAVNYVWQRSTLLATFFYLATILLYVLSRERSQKSLWFGAIVTCFLAMLSKEIAITLPLMLCCVEFFIIRRVLPRKKGVLFPFLLLLLVIPGMLLHPSQQLMPLMKPVGLTRGVASEVMSSKEYWLTQINVVKTYARMFVFPSGLNIDHDYPRASETGVGHLIWSCVVLCCLWIAALLKIKTQPILFFSVAWFFLTLSLESFVTSADLIQEHRMYLPMVGLTIGGASLLGKIYQRNIKLGIAILVFIVMTFSTLSFQRNFVWKNDVTLWSDAIKKSPRKARAWNNRGVEYNRLGFLNLALDDFHRAIELKPDYVESYFNRGNVYKARGLYEKAIEDYSQVIKLNPADAGAFVSRANIYRRQKRMDLALEDYQRALQLDQAQAETYNNRASVYQHLGEFDKAMEDYSRAIVIQPEYIYSYNNRGNMHLQKGDFLPALADYQRALEINPNFAEVYVNRAIALYELGRYSESLADIHKATALGKSPHPDFVIKVKDALQGIINP